MEKRMRKLIITLGALLCMSTLYAQSSTNWQADITAKFAQLQSAMADSTKQAINHQLEQSLQNYYAQSEHFNDSLPAQLPIGNILADNASLRIISWNYPTENGGFAYSALMVKAPNGRQKGAVALFSCASPIKPKRTDRYYANNWYGAVYYKIFAYKDYYILLGYSQYNPATQVKCIEVLDWSENTPVLGKSIFVKQGRISSRVVFEYSSQVQMYINHIPKEKQFVFDHLSPEEPNLEGLYSYYGPDFSYDGYELKRNKWFFIDDVDIKNEP